MDGKGKRSGGLSRGKSTTPVFRAVFMFVMTIATPSTTPVCNVLICLRTDARVERVGSELPVIALVRFVCLRDNLGRKNE